MGTFWSSPEAAPKRAYRWTFTFNNGPNFAEYLVKKVTKPSFTVGEGVHKYLNHTFYYPGNVVWEPINVTLVDPVNPDASKLMVEILEKSGYRLPTSAEESRVSIVNRKAAVAAMGETKLVQYGADSSVIEMWRLYNPWIKEAKFGELSYETEDLVNIDLVIRYDYAEKIK